MINRFKLYLIKILTIRHMSRKKQCRLLYLMFTFSEHHMTVYHYNDDHYNVDRDALIIR